MHDAFKTAGPTCISFSGGRTSAYLLWRVLQAHGGKLPDDAQVLFCNTGKEEEATLRFVRDCGQRWGVPIVWLEYTGSGEWVECDFDSAARNGQPFEAVIAQRGGNLPNRMARYCSSELKTRTMHRYLRWSGWTEWDTFIGIRADEPRRVAKVTADGDKVCPLAAAGVTEADVFAFWDAQPFDHHGTEVRSVHRPTLTLGS